MFMVCVCVRVCVCVWVGGCMCACEILHIETEIIFLSFSVLVPMHTLAPEECSS